MKRPYLWIVLVVLAVYGQVLFFKFTYLDDYTLIVQNSNLFIHPKNLLGVFTTDSIAAVTGGQYYRPIFAASFILNAVIAGKSPFLFHLTDLLLHLGVCLLLFRFLLNLTGLEHSALFGSLVFAVHPLLVQTVAWIPARTDSLAVLFILWYLISFDEALKTPAVKKNYFYSALAMALALASKETALMLPLISLLYAWLVSESTNKFKTLLRFVPIWAALIAAWFFGRSFALTQAPGISLQAVFTSVYLSLAAVIQYLGKIFLPFDLSTYPVMADLRLTYGLLALLIIAFGILASKHKRYKVVLFGAAWFFVFLLLSLVRLNTLAYSEVLEHRAYLPFIGILILILEFDWFKKDWSKSLSRFAAVCAVLVVLAVINIAHASSFSSGLKYWQQAVKTSPSSPFAHRQLGAMRDIAGDAQGAENEYKKVIAINPEKTLVYNNLGLLYAKSGRNKEAEIFYRWEIATNPDFDKAYMNLGNLYWQENHQDEASEYWQKTIELNPYFFQAYRNLAIYYYEKEQFDKGVQVLLEIISRGRQIDSDLLDSYKPYLPKR
jgi:tetratricopeptide (TPR) repeat protein